MKQPQEVVLIQLLDIEGGQPALDDTELFDPFQGWKKGEIIERNIGKLAVLIECIFNDEIFDFTGENGYGRQEMILKVRKSSQFLVNNLDLISYDAAVQ